jgi:hypothetical protein
MAHCKRKKKKPSKYTPTADSYDFARRSGHKRYINKIIYKLRKTTLEPSV